MSEEREYLWPPRVVPEGSFGVHWQGEGYPPADADPERDTWSEGRWHPDLGRWVYANDEPDAPGRQQFIDALNRGLVDDGPFGDLVRKSARDALGHEGPFQ